MKILLADDSTTIRMIVADMLKPLGHQVVHAVDGADAWDKFQQTYFPVVISDWQMPKLDGLGLCAAIRARPSDDYSYLILITSHGAQENYHAGIKAGADDFLQKPFDSSHLAARLIVAERLVGLQNHTKKLESLMSVCSYCKNIKSDGQWIRMEDYASSHFGLRSSHGICPGCFNTVVKPEMELLGINVDGLKAG
jgi:sigma-B regulation protein RsbU (phosphoserine phosphatase)